MCTVAVGNEFHQDIITEGQGLSGSCSFWGFETEAEWVAKRTYYKDRYNSNKIWEVVKLNEIGRASCRERVSASV